MVIYGHHGHSSIMVGPRLVYQSYKFTDMSLFETS